MPFGFNEDKSKYDLDAMITGLNESIAALLNAKADSDHTHDATEIVSGVLDAVRIPNLDASKVASGVLAAARIPNLAASKITSGVLAVARGGTGKSYGFAWQRLATSTNNVEMTYSLSGYSEVMFAANCTWVDSGHQAYLGSVILPVALLHATTFKEVYLTGGNNPQEPSNGRGFAVRATTTSAVPATRAVDGIQRNTTWYVYAR